MFDQVLPVLLVPTITLAILSWAFDEGVTLSGVCTLHGAWAWAAQVGYTCGVSAIMYVYMMYACMYV